MIGNIHLGQLLIVLLIVLLIFGTKKLRNMGGDLGSAIRDFRKGMGSDEERDEDKAAGSGESTSEEPPEAGSDKPKP